MLLTVKDACELHPMALDYSMSEQVENLSDAIAATSVAAREFFDKNYVTKGMETLLSQGLRRLGGKSDQAVFELKQAMGGGKTHSMIALGLLARDATLRSEIVPDTAREAAFGDAKLAAVNGRLGFEETFVWGEIANQLRKSAQFSKFWRDGAKAPSEKDWIELIGDESTLILLDELPPYFDYAVTRVVGNGNLAQVTTYALANLLSAALKLKRCCVVISNLSGSYEGASRQLRQAIRNFEPGRSYSQPSSPYDRCHLRPSKIDGQDMAAEALRPQQAGGSDTVKEIIDFAVQVANEYLVPEGVPAGLWERLLGPERFYLRMLDIEAGGAKKLDNYQNFAKAFRYGDYTAVMASMKPNDARLKNALELKKSEFESEFGKGPLRAVLFALYELQRDVDSDEALGHLRDLVPGYLSRRDDLMALTSVIALKREHKAPEEAQAARILLTRIKNERLGEGHGR